MKLHNILYTAGFLCLITGVLGIDGWMYKGTSLAVPVLLIALAMCLWRAAMGERICPYCGARLDPDEKCDCREENGQEESPAPDGRRD